MKNSLFVETDIKKIEEVFSDLEENNVLKYFHKYRLSRFQTDLKNEEDLEKLYIHFGLEDRREEFIQYENIIRNIFAEIYKEFEIGLLNYDYEKPFDPDCVIQYKFQDWTELNSFLIGNIRKRIWTQNYCYSIGNTCVILIDHDLEVLVYLMKDREQEALSIFQAFAKNDFYRHELIYQEA